VRDFPHDASFNRVHTLTTASHFRTGGPPAVSAYSLPVGSPLPSAPPGSADAAPAFDSGLGDLSAYVASTVPASLPSGGGAPVLPRAVYRGYDVGIAFNSTSVDLMYALAGRDLALYLLDTNDQPLLDASGALLAAANRFGRQDTGGRTRCRYRRPRRGGCGTSTSRPA
jgi:hypothetical protein